MCQQTTGARPESRADLIRGVEEQLSTLAADMVTDGVPRHYRAAVYHILGVLLTTPAPEMVPHPGVSVAREEIGCLRNDLGNLRRQMEDLSIHLPYPTMARIKDRLDGIEADAERAEAALNQEAVR